MLIFKYPMGTVVTPSIPRNAFTSSLQLALKFQASPWPFFCASPKLWIIVLRLASALISKLHEDQLILRCLVDPDCKISGISQVFHYALLWALCEFFFSPPFSYSGFASV